MSVFTASIGPKFCISCVITTAGVVPCGVAIKSPRADNIFRSVSY